MVCAAFRHRKGMQAKADETELPQAQAGLKSPSSATSKGSQFSCNRAGYSCAQEVWRQYCQPATRESRPPRRTRRETRSAYIPSVGTQGADGAQIQDGESGAGRVSPEAWRMHP